ncbi:hypothetical protein ALQ03_200079 [Pseudomonas savastanoi pv. glycinea]|uniref:Uncharacterized protein n=1 Tax=Pseudomonas savastanoi pv. glycinea TaxID=318 RepID=A0A0N8RJZ6_PSESG|nr:hypothetical protein ALO37_200051 [Pseudomonas savastanoi pv. glycinea]RMM99058.1 hypothetical protein ALQ68_200047 [Pseudomonas savastanoi pv. glycinea]RMO33519.1 hypothetical protein ALQ42_200179 [Pseudomonas savastanoi pv. glycinea]RMP53726.1 hypothetical protein ALQ21_200025 [Pseudomonas savastanoi pv. glycinea]RMQ04767.1 hypothetical protein ALQ13_200093 [Pseudomonas savastanoi pv. glycinea]
MTTKLSGSMQKSGHYRLVLVCVRTPTIRACFRRDQGVRSKREQTLA